ncbi:MAG TPA: hypothetical protein VK463_21240, partial [Desulfomonilaceae bacterium]|nr:hypothetical protein [Desulfomonilaceae bacterium]
MSDHRFKAYSPDQLLLLPPELKTWLPENHLAWFVSEMVDSLNLSEIEGHYDHLKGGKPGYHPSMMVKLLIYAYCVGVPSSLDAIIIDPDPDHLTDEPGWNRVGIV